MLVNDPVPLPLVVCVLAVVGLPVVFQHTPLAVTVAPPSDVTLPPLAALVEVIDVTDAVVNVGRVTAAKVVNDTWFPYPVPAEFVA